MQLDWLAGPTWGISKRYLKASLYWYSEVVKLLLGDKRVNPSANDNEAIREASYYGKTDVVKLLTYHISKKKSIIKLIPIGNRDVIDLIIQL